MFLRPLLFCTALLVCCSAPALAQDAVLPREAGPAAGSGIPDGSPLALTVRPSRFDEQAAQARTRQERLERRLRQNEFLFRSICIHCAPGERHSSNAPFDPAEALRR